MRLLEHQSKRLLADFGLTFTQPEVVTKPHDALAAAEKIGGPVVVKAQVPFGGRGKAGAIGLAYTPAEAAREAERILSLELRGVRVAAVSIEPRLPIARELYLGVAWDTSARLPVALLSAAGGIEVEAAATSIARRTFDPTIGLAAYEGRELAREIGLTGKTLAGVGVAIEQLACAFLAIDAVTAEINPLIETGDGKLIGVDAHVEIDDDAGYRQQARLSALGPIAVAATGRPPTPLEIEAQRIDSLDHRGVAGRVVEFDGNLGLLIGGGGASLTVFDAIQRHGGKPANYCEVGGNPTEEKVAALTALLLSKPGVAGLAVIMNVVNNTRADVMARGVLDGVRCAGRNPAETITVFRIPGSWEQEAMAIMREAGVEALGREHSLDASARLAVERMQGHAA